MSDKKGIFTKEQEAKLAQIIDQAIKLKGFPEKLDGFVFKLLLSFTDDTYADMIPEPLKNDLSALATALLEKDYKTAEILATNLVNNCVDIPMIDEEAEALIFESVIKLVAGAVKKWLNKEQGKTVSEDKK